MDRSATKMATANEKTMLTLANAFSNPEAMPNWSPYTVFMTTALLAGKNPSTPPTSRSDACRGVSPRTPWSHMITKNRTAQFASPWNIEAKRVGVTVRCGTATSSVSARPGGFRQSVGDRRSTAGGDVRATPDTGTFSDRSNSAGTSTPMVM